MTEIWKDITGYEGVYQVSSQGRVRKVDGYRILVHNQKYPQVRLGKKKFFVNRLVAIAFISNPEGLSDAHHKNGNKQDNRVENLEWKSRKDVLIEAHKHIYHKFGTEHHLYAVPKSEQQKKLMSDAYANRKKDK